MWNWLTLFRNIPGLARWRKSARQGTMLSGKVLDVSFRSCGLWLWKIFITKGYERTEWSVFFCFAQSIVWGLTCLDRPGGWGDIFPTGSTRQKDPLGGWRLKAVCLRPFALHCIELPYILRSELRLDCAAHDEHEKDRIVPINGFEWQRVKIEPILWQAHPYRIKT